MRRGDGPWSFSRVGDAQEKVASREMVQRPQGVLCGPLELSCGLPASPGVVEDGERGRGEVIPDTTGHSPWFLLSSEGLQL